MPGIDWNAIVNNAKTETDKKFQNKMSSLTSLTDEHIAGLLKDGIKKEDIAAVIKEVSDATKSNTDKANAIKKIGKGVEVLISIAKRFV